MPLRDYLEQRERELVDELSALYGQLTPKEAELAEIRRAKAAIGMSNEPVGGIGLTGFGTLGIGGQGSTLISPMDATTVATLSALSSLGYGPAPDDLCSGMTDPSERVPSRYARLTMKRLVVKALAEHFTEGATTRQMLDFFRDAWGRDIQRQNLSPQLTRLVREGIIALRPDHTWFLLSNAPEQQRKPYRLLQKAFFNDRLMQPGETVMLLPHEVGAHHEPIEDDD